MTLSTKNSRKIVVDEDEYRWSPSQDSGYMVLVAQHASGQGSKLEVIISDDKNVVIENGSYSIEVGGSNKLIMTPKLVAKVIQDSIVMGWQPQVRGSPVQLSLNGNKLMVRRGL